MTRIEYFVLGVPVDDGDTRSLEDIGHGILIQLGCPTIEPFNDETDSAGSRPAVPVLKPRPRISELADEVAHKASELAEARKRLDAARRGDSDEYEVPDYGRSATA